MKKSSSRVGKSRPQRAWEKSAVAVLTFFALCNANVSFLNLDFFRAACNFSIFLNLLLNTEDSFPFIL